MGNPLAPVAQRENELGKGVPNQGGCGYPFPGGSTGRSIAGTGLVGHRRRNEQGKGKSWGHQEQTRAALMDIKSSVEILGGPLKTLYFSDTTSPPEDVFDIGDEMYRFFKEFEPDLFEHTAAGDAIAGRGHRSGGYAGGN